MTWSVVAYQIATYPIHHLPPWSGSWNVISFFSGLGRPPSTCPLWYYYIDVSSRCGRLLIRLPVAPSATCPPPSTAPPSNEQQFLTASKLLHRQSARAHVVKLDMCTYSKRSYGILKKITFSKLFWGSGLWYTCTMPNSTRLGWYSLEQVEHGKCQETEKETGKK